MHLSHVDMNVLPVYSIGYTGKGVRVSILDDGVEGSHIDLKDNYASILNLKTFPKEANNPRTLR